MKLIAEVKHFSHSDLDGIGCIVMAKQIFTHTNYEVCDYGNVDDKVKDFIATYMNGDGKIVKVCPYERILITDISIKVETALLLEYFSNITGIALCLIDHHPTSEYLNDFEWCHVYSTFEGVKTSGTSEMYRLLIQDLDLPINKNDIHNFSEYVRLYDTWDWKRENKPAPRWLHELLYIIGRSTFIQRFTEDISPVLNDSEMLLVNIELDTIDRAINAKEKQMFKTTLLGYKAGVIYAEKYHSILGNTLCERHTDLDFVVIVNIGDAKVSFRSIKPEIDLGAISKKAFAGGGHPPAAGCEFDMGYRETVFSNIVEKMSV